MYAKTPDTGVIDATYRVVPYPSIYFNELVIDTFESVDDQNAIRFENARRRRGKRITDALAQYMAQMETIDDIQSQAILFNQALPPKLPPEVPSLAPCPRFNEIQNFLFKNRLELALDSMDFPVPEHTLYNYILERGGIQLDADEWRAFLRICRDKKNLFRYTS